MGKKLEKMLDGCAKFFDTAAKAVCIFSIFAVFVMCIEQVFCRFVLHISVGYVDEVSRYLFILSVFVGSSLSVRDEEHFSLDLLQLSLKNRPKILAAVRLLTHIATGLFLLFMIRSGMILALSTKTQRSSYLHMPMSVMYWIIPVCGIWMLAYILIKIIRDWRTLCSGNKEGGKC